MSQSKLPRIAWFSALDPSTVSNWSTRLLLPELRKYYQIELFSSFGIEALQRTTDSELRYQHYLLAAERHTQQPFDLFFYQIESGKPSYFARTHLGLQPGVCWFHEFSLPDYGPEPILNSPWQETTRLFQAFCREERLQWPAREREYKREGQLALREASMSMLSLFSNVRDHRDFLQAGAPTLLGTGNSKSYFLGVPVPTVPKLDQRRASDSAGQCLQLAYCSGPGTEGRSAQLFKALAAEPGRYCLHWLVQEQELAAAQDRLEEYGITAELVLGRSPETWQKLCAACDIALHLHFSGFGNLMPYLGISMAQGLACIALDTWELESLPKDALWRIEPGLCESSQCAAILKALREQPELLQALAAKGRDHARAQHSPAFIAAELRAAIDQALPLVRTYTARWGGFQQAARTALLKEVGCVNEQLQYDFRGAYQELGFAEATDRRVG
jgi:hypothetical protein